MACLGGLVVTARRAPTSPSRSSAAYVALVVGRALWLGEPMPPSRSTSCESGALLLFAFFMISDPKTTPDSRAGRMRLRGARRARRLVRPVPVCSAPTACSGRWRSWLAARAAHRSPAARRALRVARRGLARFWRTPVPCARLLLSDRLHAALAVSSWRVDAARAFCGFYVAKADTKLFNQASQVVLVARRRPHRPHDGQRLRGRPRRSSPS